jgi:hypothetical protein
MWNPFLIMLACTSQSWKNAEDCAQLPMGIDKDNCWSVHLVELFAEDSQQGFSIIENEVSSVKVQDYLWLEMTREVDPTTMTYCKKIIDKALMERCRMLVSRPHLHRDILRGKENSGGVPARKPQ